MLRSICTGIKIEDGMIRFIDMKEKQKSLYVALHCYIYFLFFQGLTGVFLFTLMLAALIANKVSLVWLLGGTMINNVDLETW